MKCLLLICSFSLLSLATYAQKLKLPIVENEIVYKSEAKNLTISTQEDLFKLIQKWINGYCSKVDARMTNFKQEQNVLQVTMQQVMEPDGVFDDVTVHYKLNIEVNSDGLITYQVQEPYFMKIGMRYAVYDIYRYYLQDIPYVKVQAEKKIAALRRHWYLIKTFDRSMKGLMNTFKASFDDVAVAAN